MPFDDADDEKLVLSCSNGSVYLTQVFVAPKATSLMDPYNKFCPVLAPITSLSSKRWVIVKVKGNAADQESVLYTELENMGDLVGVSMLDASTLLGVCRKNSRKSAQLRLLREAEYDTISPPRGNGSAKYIVEFLRAFEMTG